MKRYIIITTNITNIGGAQIYIRNKINFLKEIGWEIEVYSLREGTIFIEELKQYKTNIIKELSYLPVFYTRKKINEILRLLSKHSNDDEVVIETHSVNLAIWGELLAKRIKAKHIVYLLNEYFPLLTDDSKYKFLDFKHKRRELAGITNKSLQLLFRQRKIVREDESYFLKAVVSNAVENVENPTINSIIKLDINIGCITRLDKIYVKNVLTEVIKFAKDNKDHTIQLVFFGGTNNKLLETSIIEQSEGIENLKVLITGFLYPIPRKIFQLMDIFIGVSGSSKISVRENVLTISLDVSNGEPIGLLGYNVGTEFYKDSRDDISISDILQETLIKKELHKSNIDLVRNLEKQPHYKEVLKNHLEFIKQSDKHYKYFDDFKISKAVYLKRILFNILKFHRYNQLQGYYEKFKLSRCNK